MVQIYCLPVALFQENSVAGKSFKAVLQFIFAHEGMGHAPKSKVTIWIYKITVDYIQLFQAHKWRLGSGITEVDIPNLILGASPVQV